MVCCDALSCNQKWKTCTSCWLKVFFILSHEELLKCSPNQFDNWLPLLEGLESTSLLICTCSPSKWQSDFQTNCIVVSMIDWLIDWLVSITAVWQYLGRVTAVRRIYRGVFSMLSVLLILNPLSTLMSLLMYALSNTHIYLYMYLWPVCTNVNNYVIFVPHVPIWENK